MPERSVETRVHKDALLHAAEQWVAKAERMYMRISMECLNQVRLHPPNPIIAQYLSREDIIIPTFQYARGDVANDLLQAYGYRPVVDNNMLLILFGNCDISKRYFNAPFWRDSSMRLSKCVRDQVKKAYFLGLDMRRISERGDHQEEYHYLFVSELAVTKRRKNNIPYV